MPHVLIAGTVRPEGLRVLTARPDVTLETLDQPTPETLLAAMPRAEAIVLRTARLTPAMIEAAPSLKVVSRHGVGYDNVPVEALTARGIPLAIAATSNRISVAEHAFLMLLELFKQGRAFDRATRDGAWERRNQLVCRELAGRTLLVVGLGRIGTAVARRAIAFGMRVVAYDPHIPAERITATGCEPAETLAGALRIADAVSLHLPLSASTRHLVDAEALRVMRSDAVLVNTARGGLVDETALAQALREGWIAAAGLDVFEEEPTPAGHPLFDLPNVFLSPHVAGTTMEAMLRMATESATNALAGLDGRLDPSVVVNPDVLGR